MAVQKVLVVGAGIGGLAAGIALGREGIDVEIVEIRHDAAVLGVGINQPGNSLRALKSLGILDEILAAGLEWKRINYRDANNELIVFTDSSLGIDGVPANCGISRHDLRDALLRAALRAGARVTYSTEITALVDTGDSVHVTLSDGTHRQVDIVAAFDGIGSPMRRRVLGSELVPKYVGSAVWRKRLPRPRAMTETELWYGTDVKCGIIPLSETEMYLLVVTKEPTGERPAEDQLGQMLIERIAGFSGPMASIRELVIQDPTGTVYSPLLEIEVPQPWHKGRVIVLGDAVHAAAPHLTQGAAMALEDAVVLADEIIRDRPIEESFREVERLRWPRTQLVLHASHAILEQEQAITAESLPRVFAEMRGHMAADVADLEAVLNQPFRSLDVARQNR